MMTWADVIRFTSDSNLTPDRRVEKTPDEWREILTPEQYAITREKGTERSFSSQMCNLFEPGLYACVCCGTVLFNSATKFESGSGWPSFDQPIAENVIAYHGDNSNQFHTTGCLVPNSDICPTENLEPFSLFRMPNMVALRPITLFRVVIAYSG